MISVILILPLLGCFFSLLFKKSSSYFYFLFSMACFASSLHMAFFSIGHNGSLITEDFLGLTTLVSDQLSAFMIILSSLLFLLCSQLICKMKNNYIFYSLFLLMQFFVSGVFLASDLITFFIFFESVLIPMFFVIGYWGGKDKVYSSFKFFIYTLAGSVSFLLATIYLYNTCGTVDIYELSKIIPNSMIEFKNAVWIAFFITFLVKIPSFPFHTWLPNAHVQAPTAGSVILAGILIKIGAYCLIRILLQMMPDSSANFAQFAVILGYTSVIYASIVAYSQTNMKTMIAYSSIAHMGFVVAGIFSMTKEGLHGAIFQMISHGFVSSALFMCIGALYSRTGNLKIDSYAGLAEKMPKFSLLFMVFVMSSIGLPGTSGFIGEFLSIAGLFKTDMLSSIILSSGIFLGAIYMLNLSKRVIFGADPSLEIEDICVYEYIPLYILAISTIAFGLFPFHLFGGYMKHFIDGIFNNNLNMFIH